MGKGNQLNNSFALFTGTGRVFAMVCGFVMPIFLTHFLKKSDYGLYSQFYSLLLFFGSIFSFGFQSNLYYFYPKTGQSNIKSTVGNTLLVLIGSAALVFAFFVTPLGSSLLMNSSGLQPYMYILGICIFFYIPTNLFIPLLVLNKERLLSVVCPPAEIIFKVILVVSAALWFGSLKAIFIAVSLLQVIFFLLVVIYVVLNYNDILGSWFSLKLLKRQLAYAFPFGLSLVLATLFRQFDKVLCINYISSEEFAIYSLAFFGIPGIQQVYDSVSEVNLVNMTNSYQMGDIDLTSKQYKSFSEKMFAFTIPLICIGSLFANEIIMFVFGDQYEEATPFFQTYLLSFVFGTIGAGTVLRATGMTRYTLRAYLWSLPFYLVVAFVGIKYFGVWGALTSAMVGTILPKCFQIFFESNVLHVGLLSYMPWKSFGRTLVISILAIIPFALLKYCCNLNMGFVVLFFVMYIVIVYSMEIYLDVFLVSKTAMLKIITNVKNKM